MTVRARIATFLIAAAVSTAAPVAQEPSSASPAAGGVDAEALQALIDERLQAALASHVEAERVEQQLRAQTIARLVGEIEAALGELEQRLVALERKGPRDKKPLAERINQNLGQILATFDQVQQLRMAYDQLDPPDVPLAPIAEAAATPDTAAESSGSGGQDPAPPPTEPGGGTTPGGGTITRGNFPTVGSTRLQPTLPTTATERSSSGTIQQQPLGGTAAAATLGGVAPYEIVPSARAGRFGRLLVTFPGGVGGTPVEVQRAGSAAAAARSTGRLTATLAPGRYGVSVSGMRLDVDVRQGHDTLLRPGGLRVGVRGSKLWRLYDSSGRKQLHQKYGGGTVGLLPGQYVVSIDGVNKTVAIRPGQITDVR